MRSFIGRKREIQALTEPNWRERAVIVALYGRRRVGKTALVEHAYRDRTLWKFEGLENGNTRTQLALFCKDLGRYMRSDVPHTIRNWDDAFRCLEQALAGYEQEEKQPIVVFFDEFQWLSEMKPRLVSLFKYHWDNYFSRHVNATFVICGSISSFIVKKVIQSRALYGRVDLELNLHALSLSECRSLLDRTVPLSQCLDTYMVFGGIPQYLIELNPRMSLIQNLNEYAFKPSGYFFKEFDRLFISHFASHPLYEAILMAVAAGPLSPGDIARKCGVETGGGLSRKLNDLVLAGFLCKCTPVDKRRATRLVRYKVDDEYLHFYFTFIASRSPDIVAGNVEFAQIAHDRQLRQWQGYAFERLCRKHSHQIASHLRFSGINYRCGEWFKRTTSRESGAQVDLLFVRADKVLTICEMKYVDRLSLQPLRDSLARKKAALRQEYSSYAMETVLVLGKDAPGCERAARDFDHVLLAEDVFF